MANINKKRAVNWSYDEVLVMLDGVEENIENVYKQKFGVKVTASTRQEAWAQITNAVNAVGHAMRTQQQVEKKWSEVKSSSTQKLSEHKRETFKTGDNAIIVFTVFPVHIFTCFIPLHICPMNYWHVITMFMDRFYVNHIHKCLMFLGLCGFTDTHKHTGDDQHGYKFIQI
jgi:hypothetical protein